MPGMTLDKKQRLKIGNPRYWGKTQGWGIVEAVCVVENSERLLFLIL